MKNKFYSQLIQKSLSGELLTKEEAVFILTSDDVELLPLLDAAYQVREKYFGRNITLHVLNNVQNGQCSQDCKYCVQSQDSDVPIDEYEMKSDQRILDEAEYAYQSGAHRYCLVFSGHSPSRERVEHLSVLIRKIKSLYPIQVCVSHGFLNKEQVDILKAAGVDRLNHNLNTSSRYYPQICSTHDYEDRVKNVENAKFAEISVCSGVIIGMGETAEDVYEMARCLKMLKVDSIPVNFYLPLNNSSLKAKQDLSPSYCLKVLCLFRLMNPDTELRLAAGREVYLKSMQSLAFYPANSLFLNGYLNSGGESKLETFKKIKESGFSIISDFSLEELIDKEVCPKSKDTPSDKELPVEIIKLIRDRTYIGKIGSPDGEAHIKGACGDDMAFFLKIKNDVLKEIKFQTTGCFFTYACGSMTSHLVMGKKIKDVLCVSPRKVIEDLRCLPKDHCHCAILAVSTLYKAIADYWLKG